MGKTWFGRVYINVPTYCRIVNIYIEDHVLWDVTSYCLAEIYRRFRAT